MWFIYKIEENLDKKMNFILKNHATSILLDVHVLTWK